MFCPSTRFASSSQLQPPDRYSIAPCLPKSLLPHYFSLPSSLRCTVIPTTSPTPTNSSADRPTPIATPLPLTTTGGRDSNGQGPTSTTTLIPVAGWPTMATPSSTPPTTASRVNRWSPASVTQWEFQLLPSPPQSPARCSSAPPKPTAGNGAPATSIPISSSSTANPMQPSTT